MSVHPDKTALRAVDACGGTYTPEQEASGYAQGHRDALEDALKAAAPVDALMADLFDALKELLAVVRGECPAILDEDRGGISGLEDRVEAAVAKAATA